MSRAKSDGIFPMLKKIEGAVEDRGGGGVLFIG